MSAEDEIISGMLEEYKRTNIRPLNLANEENGVKKIAVMLKSSPEKHQRYNVIGFDPVQTQFLRKLVAEPILEKRIRTIRKDYFKTVMYLDFFLEFIINDPNMLDKIKAKTNEIEKIHPFLDPDLELCARYCCIEFIENYKPLAANDSRRNQFNRNFAADLKYHSLKSIDPIYEAAGKIFIEQIANNNMIEKIEKASRINDLLAINFCDTNISLYQKQNQANGKKKDDFEEQVIKMIDSKDFLKAGHYSMEAVAKKLSRQTLSDYISTMEPTKY
jgi:hypothetical protein